MYTQGIIKHVHIQLPNYLVLANVNNFKESTDNIYQKTVQLYGERDIKCKFIRQFSQNPTVISACNAQDKSLLIKHFVIHY